MRVKQVGTGGTTVTLASGCEWVIPTSGTPYARLYYAVGGQRIALRANGTLYYLLTDHLGSTTLLVDTTRTVVSGLGYLPYGQQRYTRGAALPTELKPAAGQREEAALGLYDYGARWYDPALGRFLTPDTLIPDPGNPADWDRFAYVRGNPVKYTDPSGHDVDCAIGESGCKNRVKIEKAEELLAELANSEQHITWNNLSKKEQKILLDVGWDANAYDHSDYVLPSATDISGTVEDPVVYLSIILGGAMHGPAVAGGKHALERAALLCFYNPGCAKIFGDVTQYASRLDKQTDPFHNFPRLLDPIIISYRDRVVKNVNYVQFMLEGEVMLNNKIYSGVFEIGIKLQNFSPVIVRHLFRR